MCVTYLEAALPDLCIFISLVDARRVTFVMAEYNIQYLRRARSVNKVRARELLSLSRPVFRRGMKLVNAELHVHTHVHTLDIFYHVAGIGGAIFSDFAPVNSIV